jgi:hypothetical protein
MVGVTLGVAVSAGVGEMERGASVVSTARTGVAVSM